MPFRIFFPCLAAAFAWSGAQPAVRIKWACIGNSITAGYPQANLTYVSGANRLAALIGPQDTLLNAGVSSTTVLKQGDVPYWTRGRLANVFAFRPDIISIELGTNDTKPINWQFNANFVRDLTALVDTLQNSIIPMPQVWLFLPPPIFANTFGINDSIMTNGVIPRIRQVATAKGLNLIDVNAPLRAHPNYFSDGVHFTALGADSLAATIFRSFLSQVTRVACVGNSITAGSTLTAPLSTAHPILLNMLLGRAYYVKNEGISGAYMQKAGRAPYWTTAQFADVFRFRPNIITIALGTNDSRATQWSGARFRTDYGAMIDTFSNNISPRPQIWMLRPMPAWYAINNSTVNPTVPAWGFDNGIAGNGINGFTIRDSVNPAIQQVATQRGLPTIDLYTPMLMGQPYTYNVTPAYVPDGVHPRELGHDTLAHVIYRALSGPVGIYAGGSPRRSRHGAHRIPMLFPTGMNVTGRIFSLDGKAVRGSRPAAAGLYFVKAGI